MAPSVSLQDQVDELSRLVGLLARQLAWPYSAGEVGPAAKLAALSIAEARGFLDGVHVPPPGQARKFALVLFEGRRARAASYAAQLRQPHAGSDAMRDGRPLTAEAVA